MTDTVRCDPGMENTERVKCPECGSDAVMTGDLRAMDGCWFIPRGQTTAIQRGSRVYGVACRECGALFGLKLANPDCLEKKRRKT